MEDRLKVEGIDTKKDKIVDFKNRYWDPSEELSL